jgi:hypothetical protein
LVPTSSLFGKTAGTGPSLLPADYLWPVSTEGRTPPFANHSEPFDALAGTLRGTGRARTWGTSPEELRLVEAAEERARRGLGEMARDLEWALQLMREVDRRQAAFA